MSSYCTQSTTGVSFDVPLPAKVSKAENMKDTKLFAIGLGAIIGLAGMFAGSASAAEREAISQSAKATLKSISEHYKDLTAAVKNKKLETAHEEADAIQDLTEELAGQVAAGQKAAVEKLETAIGSVHDSAESGDQTATEANLKKLDEVLNSLKDQFEPKEKLPDAARSTLQRIHEHQKDLAEAVKNKKLETAHEEADAIQDLTEELAGQVAAGQKPVVEKLEAAIGSVHDSAESGDQAATEANLKKLDEVLKGLKERFE